MTPNNTPMPNLENHSSSDERESDSDDADIEKMNEIFE